MPLNSTDRDRGTRAFAKELFVKTGLTATFSLDQLRLAFDALDDFYETLTSTLTQSNTVEQNLNAALPNNVASGSFRSVATVQQKATLVAIWAMVRGGMI